MSRWEPNARGRLGQAAMELYVERGFEATTVAEIASRAGLTERTFFRHFRDKREVLFFGAAELQELLVQSVTDAPTGSSPIAVVASAIELAGSLFQGQREFARIRQAIIESTSELKERELIKLAALATAMAEALRARGVRDPVAALAAEAGIAVLKITFEEWVSDPSEDDLPGLVRRAFDELRNVTAG